MERARKRPVRLAYLVSHPIQYQAPLLRRIAQELDLELTVLFGSDLSIRPYRDEGFGVEVTWDTPLLEGYRSEFLKPLRDNRTISALNPLSRGLLRRLQQPDGSPAFDALWVHGYASVNALQGILAANFLGIPVLLRAESWLGDRERGRLKLLAKATFLRTLRQAIAATLPIGIENRRYWQAYFGSSVPQFPMPYAVDNAWFADRTEQARSTKASLCTELDLPASLGLNAGRPVILFASKLQPRKGCEFLLRAYAELWHASPAGGKPVLILVGDGEERAHLEALTAKLGLPDVRFAGFRNQSELPRFFALADIFILPSRHEPWGLIVNEAMASGCPVIVSSAVGCHRDLVTDGAEGHVYLEGDPDALTDALRSVLASPERAQRMGGAARRRVAQCSYEADVRGLRAALAFTTRKLNA